MSLALQSSQNLAIQLQNIFDQELPLLAQLGERWNLYSRGPGEFRVIRILNNDETKRWAGASFPANTVEFIPAIAGKMALPYRFLLVFKQVADYSNINAAASIFLVSETSSTQWPASLGTLGNVLAAGSSTLNLTALDDGDYVDNSVGIDPTNEKILAEFLNADGGLTGGDASNTVTLIADFTTVPITSW